MNSNCTVEKINENKVGANENLMNANHNVHNIIENQNSTNESINDMKYNLSCPIDYRESIYTKDQSSDNRSSMNEKND